MIRMEFKDILCQDIGNVFLNPEEFGEIHQVDGEQMPVIIDGNEVTERSKKQIEKGRIEGIYEKQIVMYVSVFRFGPMPAIGRILRLDSSSYRVEDAINEGGIYSITLGAVRA